MNITGRSDMLIERLAGRGITSEYDRILALLKDACAHANEREFEEAAEELFNLGQDTGWY